MFKREHHIRVAAILQALNADLLMTNGCYFGGGTAIVLSHQEYRESVDIDFLVSNRKGYQTIRQLMVGDEGIQGIARTGMKLNSVREIRADQYGIRTLLQVAKTEIKFEIIFEGRIELESPQPESRICGIATLSLLDMAASKLLANSDRWTDDSVFSRDIIDLAMLELPQPLLARAIKKAADAYGESISRDLTRTIERLKERVGRLDECMTALKMDKIAKALLWKRIRKLKPA